MAQKAKISWQGSSQGMGTRTGRALGSTAQLRDTQNTLQLKCQCSAKPLCPSALPGGFWCDLSQIFTCHTPNNALKWAKNTGRERGRAAPPSFSEDFVCSGNLRICLPLCAEIQ